MENGCVAHLSRSPIDAGIAHQQLAIIKSAIRKGEEQQTQPTLRRSWLCNIRHFSNVPVAPACYCFSCLPTIFRCVLRVFAFWSSRIFFSFLTEKSHRRSGLIFFHKRKQKEAQ